jgi:Tol biopolymer transport system component
MGWKQATRAAGSIASIVLLALLGAGGARAEAADLVLVANTGVPSYGVTTNPKHRPAISADGRFVAYVAQSGATEHGDPLFLRDMRSDKTVKVVQPEQFGSRSGFGTSAPVLSNSGRYLAFASQDPGLSDDDVDLAGPNPVQDIFVSDRVTGKVTLVSRRSGPHGETSERDSNLPSISADGRYVAYGTSSTNLNTGSRLVVGGIFSRDLRTEANRMVAGFPGIQFWVPDVFSPDISGDGRRVAYGSQYSPERLHPNGPQAEFLRALHRRKKQIMLADPRWERPRAISRANGRHGALADTHCREASVSGSGRFVAFTTGADNLVPGDDNGAEDVFVRDVRFNRTVLVSRLGRSGPQGDGDSGRPSISADGRYVAFQSRAANLSPADPDEEQDIYVKDLETSRLTLASPGLDGEPSNARSGVPVISADGRFVAFASTASNLSPEIKGHALAFYRFQLGA